MADKLAWLVRIENLHGITRVAARIVRVNPEDGELTNIEWRWRHSPEAGDEFGGLAVGAYINGHGQSGRVWGMTTRYTDVSIDSPEHARAITRVLVKLDKGGDALKRDEGYVADGDYAGMLIRVGRILKITDYRVANPRKSREMSGQRYRRTDGSGLQSWLSHAVSEIDAGRIHEYVN